LFGKFKKGKVMKNFIIAAVGTASFIASADAGVLGYSAFSYTASNGNVIIDVFTVVSNASDRLLNVFNVNLTTTQGGSTLATFVQQTGTATRGWKPDGNSSTRSNIIDSFMTIGVNEGTTYEGQYYAAANTSPDGSFTFGWSTLGTTVPANAGWFLTPPTLPDSLAESLTGMTGTRVNLGPAGQDGALGIWCAHLVMSGSTTSCLWGATAAVKDGVTSLVSTGSVAAGELIPAPGAIALMGLAGFAARRRRA
jgi:MYXO-CTERM domain-containing protein